MREREHTQCFITIVRGVREQSVHRLVAPGVHAVHHVHKQEVAFSKLLLRGSRTNRGAIGQGAALSLCCGGVHDEYARTLIERLPVVDVVRELVQPWGALLYRGDARRDHRAEPCTGYLVRSE